MGTTVVCSKQIPSLDITGGRGGCLQDRGERGQQGQQHRQLSGQRHPEREEGAEAETDDGVRGGGGGERQDQRQTGSSVPA